MTSTTAPRPGPVATYRALTRRRGLLTIGLGVVVLVLLLTDLSVGGASMPLGDLSHAILSPWNVSPIDRTIVWQTRLPMSVTAVLVGAALGAAGAEMQTILGNPLAEPYTLGISAAAGFGAALATVTGVRALPLGPEFGMAGTAWVFAVAACGLILVFGRIRGAGAESMILLGIAIVFLFNALLALMQYIASQDQLQEVVFWTMGSVGRATWPQIAVLAVVFVILLPYLYGSAWQLTALRMGDERAAALGVRVNFVRTTTLIGVSLLAATAVAIAGTIGFIGLVGPHIARVLVGEDQRYFLTTSLLSGAALLTAASVVSKLIEPGAIIPVGIITAIVGVPVFLVIIMSRRQRNWS